MTNGINSSQSSLPLNLNQTNKGIVQKTIHSISKENTTHAFVNRIRSDLESSNIKEELKISIYEFLSTKLATTNKSDFNEVIERLKDKIKQNCNPEILNSLYTLIETQSAKVILEKSHKDQTLDFLNSAQLIERTTKNNALKLFFKDSSIDIKQAIEFLVPIQNDVESLKYIFDMCKDFIKENKKLFWNLVPKECTNKLKLMIISSERPGKIDKNDSGLPYSIIKTDDLPAKHFELVNTYSDSDNQEIPKEIEMPENKKIVMGQGTFGKVRLARNLENGEFYAVKKLKNQKDFDDEVRSYDIVKEMRNGFNKIEGSKYVDSKKESKGYIFTSLLTTDLANLKNKFIDQINDTKSRLIKSFPKEKPLKEIYTLINSREFDTEQTKLFEHYKLLVSEFEKLGQYCIYKLCLHMNDLHGKNIIHQDLKPANLMLDRHGELFVIDYGTTKNIGDIIDTTQSISGTPDFFSYEALEVISSLPVDLPDSCSELSIQDICKDFNSISNFIKNDLPNIAKETPQSYKPIINLLYETLNAIDSFEFIALTQDQSEKLKQTLTNLYSEFTFPKEYQFDMKKSEIFTIGRVMLSLLGKDSIIENIISDQRPKTPLPLPKFIQSIKDISTSQETSNLDHLIKKQTFILDSKNKFLLLKNCLNEYFQASDRKKYDLPIHTYMKDPLVKVAFNMIHPNPDKRGSLDDIIDFFEFQIPKVPNLDELNILLQNS